MKTELRPYPEYKDSGLPWLGWVPAHWEEKRSKYYFREVDERSVTGDKQLLSVSHVTGVTPRKANVTMFMAESNAGHKICRPGDLVINTMWAWMAAMGVARQVGLVSPSYGVYRPLRDDIYAPEYVDHLLRTQPYASEYLCRSTGIRGSRLRLYPDDFLDIRIVRPPLDEQEAMVRFIDRHDRTVRRFIRNRRRLIGVLNEQKQAIINRAVTRGLDPNVPLKPSGIDWLGDIPEHWDVVKLKYAAHVSLSGVDRESVPTESPVRFVGTNTVYSTQWIRDSLDLEHVTATELERDRFALQPGDVVLAKDSVVPTRIGVPALVTESVSNAVCGYHLALIRPKKGRCFGQYLFWYLSASQLRSYFVASSTGTTIIGINQATIGTTPIVLPPPEQQDEICQAIHRELSPLDAAINRAKGEIDLIREYRTRLIADVVTGKVDVRHLVQAAASTRIAVQPKRKTTRRANIYFKRAVFAAEIVHRLHAEPTFGHVKFEKLIFLCEKQCGVDIGTTYSRQAAGPYDSRALRSIDSQMERQQWYAAQKVRGRYRYVPLSKAGGHKIYFNRYFADIEEEFSNVIETFRKVDTERCEIVATLYSAWSDLLKDGQAATDGQIVEQVLHHWHDSKHRISEGRWRQAIGWMKKKGLVPKTGGCDADD